MSLEAPQEANAYSHSQNNPQKRRKFADPPYKPEKTPDGGYKIKTYYPTMEEMKDFSSYMKHIHDTGGNLPGLAKIVPPQGYTPRKIGYDDESLYKMEITSPIKQQITGESGLYQQMNFTEKKKLTVREFKNLAEQAHATPVHTTSEELERHFWRSLLTSPSLYGADVPGTLYDEDEERFNLTKLNTILDDIRSEYGVTIEGVNTTYLYFGMWKSSFCWHTEDMDLYSINYLHTGAPKAWYCIPPEHGRRFEDVASNFFPHHFRECRAFLRHKTTMISPQVLRKFSIPFSRCTQNAGEFMITFPYSYHSGFNHGFNIAEATNFALEYWIDYGKWATRCECSEESVKISMQAFVKRYQADRYENWIRGRDVCKDPRDPKERLAPAPKPNEYDLYLRGKHDRTEEDIQEEQRRIALQQNLSSNLKKSKLNKLKISAELYRASLIKNTGSRQGFRMPTSKPNTSLPLEEKSSTSQSTQEGLSDESSASNLEQSVSQHEIIEAEGQKIEARIEKKEEEREFEPLQIGARVIVQSRKGPILDCTVESTTSLPKYKIYFPSDNTTVLGISERLIANRKEFKLGDKVYVKNTKSDSMREGKFVSKEIDKTECLVRYPNGKTERLHRKNIYLNVDQLSPSQIQLYLENISRPVDDTSPNSTLDSSKPSI